MPNLALVIPILLAFAASVAAALTPRPTSPKLAFVAAALCFAFYAVLAWQAPPIGWVSGFWSVPALDMQGGLLLDGLAAVFALLISGIGMLIFLYTGRYLADDTRSRRLVVMLLFFMMAMLGAVTADDVIVLFIFWELTSLTSFFLVGYDHEKAEARKAALQALMVTAGGGLALLAGLLMLVVDAGTTSLSGIIAAREVLLGSSTSTAAMLLILLGCFTKSAQLPFHFWLPSAMAAPTPVSAYLHSATMVKLGIYVMARFSPLYAEVPLWHGLLTCFGLATALVATIMALRATDLKRILAYTTVAALGILTLMLGIGTPMAMVAAITFLLVHAFYKAGLFLIAGILDHETGLRDATQLQGLGRAMPLTFVAALLASASMAGLPPFLGFVGKEIMYETAIHSELWRTTLVVGLFLVNAGTVAIAAIMGLRLFLGPRARTPLPPHDPGGALLAGPMVLGLLSLLAGLFLATAGTRWIEPAAAATLGRPTGISLQLWHGVNLVLLLSLATLITGLLIFRVWNPLRLWLQRQHWIDRYSPTQGYDATMHGLTVLARGSTNLFQHGSLRGYIAWLFGVAAVAMLAPLLFQGGLALPSFWFNPFDGRWLAFVALVVGSIAAARAQTAFAAVIAVGLVGFAIATVFLMFGAPDVAFTQFSVEILMVVILATTLARIPLPQRDTRSRSQKRRDAGIATLVGVAVAGVLLSMLTVPFDRRLSDWFGEHSLLSAHGHNVVNVILVDFRALDTLGEITVLAIAAFGVVALLRAGGRGPRGERGGRRQPRRPSSASSSNSAAESQP